MAGCCYASAARVLLRDCYATALACVRLLVLCAKPCVFVNIRFVAVLLLLCSLAYSVFCAYCCLLRLVQHATLADGRYS